MDWAINSMKRSTNSMRRHLERPGWTSVCHSHIESTKFNMSGRDFAKIADVMEEEQMTYARSHVTHHPPPTQAARQAEMQYQQKQGNIVQQPQGHSPAIRKVLSQQLGKVNQRNLSLLILLFGGIWIAHLLLLSSLQSQQRNI